MKTSSTRGYPAQWLLCAVATGVFCCLAPVRSEDPPRAVPPTQALQSQVLLRSMFRLNVADQVAGQAESMVEQSDEATKEQVSTAAGVHRADVGASIRKELEDCFGEEARQAFGGFVDAYSKAEAAADAEYLGRLVVAYGEWGRVPQDYASLRKSMVQDVLRDDIAAAGKFLGDVQTWLDFKKRSDEAPPLRAWLDRAADVNPASMATVKTTTKKVTPQKSAKRNPLRDSEAKADEFEVVDDDAGGALDSFGTARGERRKKALEDAQAGMQQVAEERRAAEEEYAAKKTAQAQAEAEAVRKHAEKLASAETEAIEQRKNSWSGRLKSILSTTIGATSGAFLGEVGGRAGKAAADAVFDTESGGRHERHE